MRVFQIKCSLTSVSGIFQNLTIGHLQLLFSQPLFPALEQVCLGEFYHSISLMRLNIVCTCMYYHNEQFNVILLPSLISKQGVYLSIDSLNWLTLSGLMRVQPPLALWCHMPANISSGENIGLLHGCANVDLMLKNKVLKMFKLWHFYCSFSHLFKWVVTKGHHGNVLVNT